MSAVAEPTLLDTIAGTVASTLKIPVDRLDVDADFDSFGMDSIIAIELMTNLSKQLKISITPAQLTAVKSIRELAGALDAAASQAPSAPAPQAPAAPAARAVPAPAARAPVASASARAVAARRRPEPRTDGAASLARSLRFVEDEYGLDLRGERFSSKEALIDHLVEHHADALLRHYGLSGVEEHDAAPVEVPAETAPAGSRDIAIVGMACEFADAKTPEALWRNLVGERSSIRPIDGERWRRNGGGAAPSAPRWGALIEDVDCFDPAFFGLSEDEARLCDPQERLVMQAIYHALQHAGIRADKLRGSRTALFLGYEYAEYEQHLRRHLHRVPSAPVFSSSSPIFYLANRISFVYDFKGPSEVVNASCASSGLAIHRACQALAQGECDLAICGGVSLNLFADDYAAIAHYGLLSPDGSCGVFDDDANGFTRGEGLGLLVLKRLDDAEAANNRIFARVVATHQNNRGRASFISEIKHEAITQVIAECYQKHGIEPDSVRYIEVDGYATKWGDSFEFEGIRNAFGSGAGAGKHCALGSIKGNIGHVEPASGVASAIKIALALHHKRFPATITKKKLNSFIDIEAATHPLYIADRALDFDALRRHGEPLRAGVNSFSDSGVNVHLLFEEYRTGRDRAGEGPRGPQLFVFSARTPECLVEYLGRYADHLRAPESPVALEDLAYTLQTATEPMEQRLAIVAASQKELLESLTRAMKLLRDDKSPESSGSIFIGRLNRRDSSRIFDVITSRIGEERLLESLRAGQLKEIALLWTGGIDMPWDQYWREVVLARRRSSEAPPRLVDVPPYPFAKKRYWLDFESEDGAQPREEAPLARPVKAKGEGREAPRVTREWRFSGSLDAGERSEPLDAEEKIRLFLLQESACLLGVPREEIDVGWNFLQLGFDSVGMAMLIQQLIRLLDENISPSVVFSHPDIESLARHLAEKYRGKIEQLHVVATAAAADASDAVASARAQPRQATAKSDLETWFVSREAATGGLLVPMQTNATGTPVFAVPGADGSVLSLQTLSRAMDGVRPMFAFQAVGLDGTRGPLGTVSAMADANIAALAAMRDGRRLSLLGHSNGAIVAFEMARKLLKKNVAVERLVLLDCRAPASSTRNVADEISEAFVNVIKALGGERQLDVDEFRRVPEDRRADYLYELIRRNGIETPKEHFMLAYRLSLANEKACRSYRPQKLPKACETVVVRATQSNGDAAPDLGWNKYLAKPATCIEIDADHLSVVGAEGSAVIAKIFR